ncbi:unnamed protein product [Closterium sp. Yama58-4]|nr:unnamed protein product [Closterium sp. Yama58-4]
MGWKDLGWSLAGREKGVPAERAETAEEGGGVGGGMVGETAGADDEVPLLDDEEVKRADKEVIQAVFERVVEAQAQLHNYKSLIAFALFTALYLLMLCLQAQSFQSYQVATAHNVLLPPDYSKDSSYSFASSSAFYTWLNDSIIQAVWTDPQCGDGTCTPPTEVPAVGRFGCALDCGVASNVTPVTLALRWRFASSDAMAASQWNLCSTAIRDVCWFEGPQGFSEVAGWQALTLQLPDNDWFVSLTAPDGGVSVYVYESQPTTTPDGPQFPSASLDPAAAAAASAAPPSSPTPAPPPSSAGTPASAPSAVGGGKGRVRPSNGTGANVLLALIDGCVVDGESNLQRCRQTCAVWTLCLPQLCTNSSSASSGGTTSPPMRVASLALGSCFQACNAMLPRTSFLPPDNVSCSQAFTLFEPFVQTPSCTDILSSTAVPGEATTAAAAAEEAEAGPLSARLLSASAPDDTNQHSLMTSVLQHHQQVRQQLQETWAQQHEAAMQHHAVGGAHVSATATTPTNIISSRLLPPQGTHSPAPASATPPITRDQLLVWESLGTSEGERIRACQVAVARALYTAVKENCLAGPTGGATTNASSSAGTDTTTSSSSSMGNSGGGSLLSSSPAKSLSLASRSRLVAFLCTLFGGPVANNPLCNFTEPSSGRQLKGQAELVEYIRATHRTPSRRFSAAQQSLFIQILIMALQSVVQKMPDDAVQAATRLLHAYDDAVVSSDASSCPQADFTVLWDSTSFARRAIADGQRVTWVWNDDNYHELRGPVSSEPFLGFGAGRLGLSRLVTCAWDNIGAGDATDEPAPCVLRSPGDTSAAHFTYTKVFGTARDMTVKDSPQSLASTLLRATPMPEPPPSTSVRPYEQLLGVRCAPACALAMLANGRCDPACNVAACDFDGGDCACATAHAARAGRSTTGSAGADVQWCECSVLQTRGADGACCEAAGVGEAIKVPFRLRRFGPNVHPLDATPATNASLPRTVSQYNSVLVGLVIVQYRWNSDRCANSRFHFQEACVGGESARAFGVNPVFLPSSSLYNPNVAVTNTTAFTNQPFANPFELNAKGLPFAFQQLPGSGRFPIVFDVNLDNAGATRRLQYLVDGFFIDNYTRTIHVGLITRNANEHLFTATKATLTVQSGGSMEGVFQVQPVNVEYYNMNDSTNVARLVVELLFVAAVAWSIVEEVKEMLWTWKVQRRSFWHYASKGWTWVDWLSIALQITCIAIWISVAVMRAQGFSIQPHYDIYYTLDDNPRYWSLPNPPVGYQSAMSAVDTLGFITNLCAVYFALQGINVFIIVLRLLKLMDFQPNMGVITRSLRVALPSLLHFFILFFVVFVAYATYGYLVFGMTLVQFSTLWLSLQTCFYMMVGQFGVMNFQQMVGWQYAAAMVFWFSFVIIFCFILFNFLIAIIVDAFMAVKESSDKAPAIYQDMYLIVVRFLRRVASPYTRYSRLLRHLIRLGAENTAHAVLEKSIRQSGQQCLSSSLHCGREARGGRHDGSSNLNGQADADGDGDGRADAVANGGPGRDGAKEQQEGVPYKSMQAQGHFDAQQQVLDMVGADETGLSGGESKKGLLASGGVAKSQAADSTNTQLDAHAATAAAAAAAGSTGGSTGGGMVEPAVQRRRSFWRLKTLDERETVVVVGDRHLNAHSLSAVLRRAHARMRRSLSDEHEGDPMNVAALGAILMSELGESLPPADATAASSTDGGEAAKKDDLVAMQQHVEALRADVARGFDQVRQQLAADFQSSQRNQLPQDASPSLRSSQLADGQEEAGRGGWEQVLMQVEKIRKEAQRERAEAQWCLALPAGEL